MTTATTDPKTETFRTALAMAVDDLRFAVHLHLADPEKPVSPYVAALARRAAELVAKLPTDQLQE